MKDSKDIKSYDVVKKFYYLPDDNRYAKKGRWLLLLD